MKKDYPNKMIDPEKKFECEPCKKCGHPVGKKPEVILKKSKKIIKKVI